MRKLIHFNSLIEAPQISLKWCFTFTTFSG